jgi:ribonucleotide reductase beta subunit family protein with ferritin-like domain
LTDANGGGNGELSYATEAMTTATLPADQISYEDLYERWEHGNWSATEIDLSVDRDQWQNTFTEIERRGALWTYSMFFHGEDSVADNLSPYIDAAPREEQKYFLATQQVDEARHAVLFARFMREVAGEGQSLSSSLEATRPELTWGFKKTFARLDKMADELRRDRSKPKLAQAITLYHLVIEATLAQPGQHLIEEGLKRRAVLPGFREGIGNVSKDEQRHIAFGVKMIADLVREDPDCEPAVEELLREIFPYTAAVSSRRTGTSGTSRRSGSRSKRSTRTAPRRWRCASARRGWIRSECGPGSRSRCRPRNARGAAWRCSAPGTWARRTGRSSPIPR